MKQNNKKYILGTIVAILLLSIGVTYAYWRANIKGEGKNISVTFGDVSIIFTDSTEIIEEDVTLPWSTTKTFTVQNEGTQEFFYDINLKDLINTLVTEDYLQYKITSTNGYNMTDYKPINKQHKY